MELDARVCDRARLARDARFDGRFYIAVLSTGIYCRPICPSRTARKENVRYFRSAAEAVAAGFRACLRCRPEAAPGTPRWNGTSSTVRRALRLIEEGALQEQTLQELARRLGVSARQLHRLFTTHLGASPTAVAKTWRLTFARQLLRDTNLPMSRVATAAGFRTVRRFNDAIRAVYRRTPSELRRRRPAALQAGRDEYAFRLSYRPPYDWEALFAFLQTRAIPGVEEVASGSFRRTFSQAGLQGVVEVRNDARARSLEVRVRHAEPAALLSIVSRVRGMFDLDADVAVIRRHFHDDPLLGPLVRSSPGLRVPGAWDPFEMAVRALLGEGIEGGAAELVRRCGERLSLPEEGRLTRVFPSAAPLCTARLEHLGDGQARSIRALAQAAVGGLFDLAAGSDEECLAKLANIPGVGESTAQHVALRAFRHPDAFPQDDATLRGVAGPGLARLSERWRPWRAYAAVHLWRAAVQRAKSLALRAARAG